MVDSHVSLGLKGFISSAVKITKIGGSSATRPTIFVQTLHIYSCADPEILSEGGLTLTLGSFVIFQGIWTRIAKKSYIL